MFTALKFPLRFDPQLLKADAGKILPEEWQPHYNQNDYGGSWRGVALRSGSGRIGDLTASPLQGGEFQDTPLLERCPYFRKVLAEFPCPLKSARLLSLAPESFILEHFDRDLQYEDGEIRIHIPIHTHAGVEFYLVGERLLFEEGCTYYLNASLPHRVNNRGPGERIHLILDAKVNEWVHALFERATVEDFAVPRIGANESFAEFQKAVLEDFSLQEELLAIEKRQQFIDALCRLGKERGFDFNAADVDATMKSVLKKELPQSIPFLQPEKATRSLRGWMPLRIHFHEARPIVEWAHRANHSFKDPFFESTVQRSRLNPFASLFRRYSPLDLVEELEPQERGLPPSGFIFHTSRCGSTLVAQMLAALPDHLVISEAGPIEQIVQANLQIPSIPEQQQIRWLRCIIGALGRRTAGESRYFIKLDMWHIHRLPLFRAAFPDTPWIFLFRDLLEVAAAQVNVPGLQSSPGMMDPRAVALSPEDVTALTREEWCFQVIARAAQSVLRFRHDPKGMFVDYKTLPESAWGQIAEHFCLALDQDAVAKMQERAQFDAKNPFFWTGKEQNSKQFKSESQRSRAAALLGPLYDELQSCCREGLSKKDC